MNDDTSQQPADNVLTIPRESSSGQWSGASGQSQEPTTDHRPPTTVYDPAARNRFEFTVRHTDGRKYDTAHVYGPLTDERYLQWLNEFHIRGNDDDVEEESREASVRLWNDIIVDLDNVEIGEGKDFRDYVPSSEKVESLNRFLAVALSDEDDSKQPVKRILDDDSPAGTCVVTEAWFNGEVVTQRHELRPASDELVKKYARIQAKRFKQERVGGLRRKAKIEYVPQDARIGELYDDMLVRVEGFAGNPAVDADVPLRFKTFVVHHVFEDAVAEKK